MLSIYVDPLKLQTDGSMFDEIRRYVDFVKGSRPTTPDGEILVPGEIENRNRATSSNGLELDDTTWGQIVEAAKSVGVQNDLIDSAILS